MDLNNAKIFSKINLWWVDAPFYKETLKNTDAGQSIAVLKTAIVLAMESDFNTRISKVSFTDLEEITGLSRPMVSKAIKILHQHKIIKIESSSRGRINCYRMIDKPEEFEADSTVLKIEKKASGWTKLPYKSLFMNLRTLPNKGRFSLGALKNYLVILKYRPNNLDFSQITHEKFIEKCGIQANMVKGSNDLLINNDLIALAKKIERGSMVTSPNMYFVKGLGVGRRGQEQKDILDEVELQEYLDKYPSLFR